MTFERDPYLQQKYTILQKTTAYTTTVTLKIHDRNREGFYIFRKKFSWRNALRQREKDN